jgi:hypothetical protein
LISDVSLLSDTVELPFHISMNLPKNVNLDLLQRFCDAGKLALDILYEQVTRLTIESGGKGMLPFLVFHKDVIGAEAEWENKIDKWGASYLVYVKHHKEGARKADIVRDCGKLFTNSKDLPNSTHKLDGIIGLADQLKLSAKNGTFPL